MSPRRIQLRQQHDGPKAIACTRRKGSVGPWGNPYIVGIDGTPEECVATFRRLYDNPLAQARIKRDLAGKVLGCTCKVHIPASLVVTP